MMQIVKLGFNHDDGVLPQTLKKRRAVELASLLHDRHPRPEIKLLSFDQAVANLPNPKSKPKTKTKTTALRKQNRPIDPKLCKTPQNPSRPQNPTRRLPSSDKTTLSSSGMEKAEAEAKASPKLEASPKRAARAAELKARFATTIFKAHHSILFNDSSAELKKKVREWQQREAARTALLKVEEAADGRDNMEIFKELEALSGSALHHPCPNSPYALHCFGLILKL